MESTSINKLEIYHLDDSIYSQKENGTKVNYFIFDEYEIHQNVIPPNTVQEWHMHRTIEEALVVTRGEILVMWEDQEKIYKTTVSQNTVVRVKDSIHTIANQTNENAYFLVFRMVPEEKNKREIIKNDKVVFSELKMEQN